MSFIDDLGNCWHPVSHQQRKKYLECLVKGPTPFNVIFWLKFERAGKALIEKALGLLWNRHEILRSTYEYIRGDVYQRVHDGWPPGVEIQYIDLINSDHKDWRVSMILEELGQVNSDFNKGPIIHLRLVDYDPDTSGLIFCGHHIISDGHSTELLKTELQTIHNALTRGEDVVLPRPKYQIKEYALFVNRYLNSDDGIKMMESYRNKVMESISMVKGVDRSADNSYKHHLGVELKGFLGESRPFWYDQIFGNVIQLNANISGTYICYIEERLLRALKITKNRFSCSVSLILLACFSLLMYLVQKTNFVRIFMPVSIVRTSEEWRSVVGWLNGENVFCQQIDLDQEINDFVRSVSKNLFSLAEYQHYPFERLLNDLDLPIGIVTPALLNIIGAGDRVIGRFEPVHIQSGNGIFEFDCTAWECKNGIHFRIIYAVNTYSRADIERFFNQYVSIVSRFVDCKGSDLVGHLI